MPAPAVAPVLDVDRYVSYSPVVSTQNFTISFPLFGDDTDVVVYVNGVKKTLTTDYTVLSPSGVLSTLIRPLTDAYVQLNVAISSGTVEIYGARRPRRTVQATAPYSTRDFNLAFSDLIANMREIWSQTARGVQVPFGETGPVLPAAATRASKLFGFDAAGAPSVVSPSSGGVVSAANILDASAAGRALLQAADAAAQRTLLSLGSLALLSTIVNSNITANTIALSKMARVGNAGQVLTSAGAGADMAFAGGCTLLDSQVKSGVATVDIALPAGYRYFKLFVREVIPATTGTDLYLRVSQNSGVSYVATGYDYGANFANATSGTTGFYSAATGTTTAIMLMQLLPNANGFNDSEITIFPGTASRIPRVKHVSGWVTNVPSTISSVGNGQSGSSVGAATNLRLLMSSGNVSLVYDLYGFS